MAWYRCLVRGENFPGRLVDEAGLVGFYVTRFIEAADPAAAELVALQKLRAEPKLAPPPGYTPSGQARVFFEEIEEVVAEKVPAGQPGFAWYSMNDADDGPSPDAHRLAN